MRYTVVIVSFLLASPALAQTDGDELPEDPSEDAADGPSEDEEAGADALTPEEEEARALFTAGRVAFEHGELERALEHFVRAYELSRRPGMLFNIGNTHDRLRHDAEAIAYLTRYLEEVPDAENAEFVRSRIEVLRENAASSEAERARLIEAANRVDATASDAGIALMIGGGVGLLASIGPIVWLVQASNQLNQCMPVRDHCDPRPLAGKQDAAIALTVSFLLTSSLALGAGVVLFAISPRGGAQAAPAEVACMLLPGGLGCSGRF